MTAIPLAYIVRNLWTRKLTTALTAGGMALVVFVFATVLMLDAACARTLVATGQPDNIAGDPPRARSTEVQSGVDRAARRRSSRASPRSRSAPAARGSCRRRPWC